MVKISIKMNGDVGCGYSPLCSDFPDKCFMCDRPKKKSYFKPINIKGERERCQ